MLSLSFQQKSLFYQPPNSTTLKSSLKQQKAIFDQTTDQLLNSAITAIIKILEPSNVDEVKSRMVQPHPQASASKIQNLSKILFTQLSDNYVAPSSVFGPLAGLSQNHSSEELSKLIDQTLALLE